MKGVNSFKVVGAAAVCSLLLSGCLGMGYEGGEVEYYIPDAPTTEVVAAGGADWSGVREAYDAINDYFWELTKDDSESRDIGYLVWVVPEYYHISSPFGWRFVRGRFGIHRGLDISGADIFGASVVAATDGTVSTVGYDEDGYGNYVILNHGGGNYTVYAHLSATSVEQGASVVQGDVVGEVGSTGNSTGAHLHFEVRKGGVPVNPLPYLPYKG